MHWGMQFNIFHRQYLSFHVFVGIPSQSQILIFPILNYEVQTDVARLGPANFAGLAKIKQCKYAENPLKLSKLFAASRLANLVTIGASF